MYLSIRHYFKWLSVCLASLALYACSSSANTNQADVAISASKTDNNNMETNKTVPTNTDSLETITLGAGCFWCVEAVFQQLQGVVKVESGYAGGAIKNPSYREVCTGRTGHAEAVQVSFDPQVISLQQILDVFWNSHDPTTLNRQGADAGTQYRSAIFYHTEAQKAIAEQSRKQFDETGPYGDPVVTEITPFTNFYKAEDYHQDYFAINGHEPYCQMVIRPKIDKVQKQFKNLLK
jgi:peptide-methionine (S)-S-oxide reductase